MGLEQIIIFSFIKHTEQDQYSERLKLKCKADYVLSTHGSECRMCCVDNL